MPDERELPAGVPPATEDIGLPTLPSPGRLPPLDLPPAADPVAPGSGDGEADAVEPDVATVADAGKPRLVGVNHVALEVSDLDAALAFYGAIFTFTLRGRVEGMAFLDMGDQFLALAETGAAAARPTDFRPDGHFGLVVDDRSRAKALAEAAGARLIEGAFLDFLDPWGNRIEVVDYADVQFTKAPGVLTGMGLSPAKSAQARRQLADKGMAPEDND